MNQVSSKLASVDMLWELVSRHPGGQDGITQEKAPEGLGRVGSVQTAATEAVKLGRVYYRGSLY